MFYIASTLAIRNPFFFLDRGGKMKNLRGLLLAFLVLSLGISDFLRAQDQQGITFFVSGFLLLTLTKHGH